MLPGWSEHSTTMTINADETFTTGEKLNGRWTQLAGMLVFTFNTTEATYAGNLASRSITGVSTTFDGSNGCFYMLQEGVPTALTAKRLAGTRNAAGKS